MIASHRMIAKMPTIAAIAYKYSIGQPFMYPRIESDYTSNFLEMGVAVPSEPYVVNPIARHGRSTASSSCMPTTRKTPPRRPCVSLAPRGANPFAWVAAGIAGPWGTGSQRRQRGRT